jgi:spore germination protein YaaH
MALAALGAPALAGAEQPVRHYYAIEAASRASFEAHSAAIDLISPTWIEIDADAAVIVRIEADLARMAVERRVPVAPLVVNRGFDTLVLDQVLLNPRVRRRVVAHLARRAREERFGGLQIDFEGLTVRHREAYAVFLEELAAKTRHKGFSLSVAVAAPLDDEPGDVVKGAVTWRESEAAAALDYARIGRAVDFVSLMTYDQHTQPAQPGPVAGLPWVEACLRRLLETTPARKLMIGVPLYFRDFGPQGVSEGSFDEAMDLAMRHGAAIEIDAVEREMRFSYDENGEAHTVWLQDGATLLERIRLVKKHGLRGYSAWRLGHEDPLHWTARP